MACDIEIYDGDCVPGVWEICDHCEAEICGRCLKVITLAHHNPYGKDICPNCGENIYFFED